MPCAFTGGPYYSSLFLAASESIMVETLADCLTHSGWTMVDKVSAWASAHPIPPTNGLAVVVGSETFTFKTTPSALRDVAIGSSLADATNNFVAAINAHSSACSAAYDAASTAIVVSHKTGGSVGNGTPLYGWLDWTSDVAYGAPHNALWLGGYKFRTGFASTGVALGAIPSIAYVFQAATYDSAWFTDAWGWPNTGVGVQFMSADESVKGWIHLVTSGPGASMKFIGGPAQFFLFRTDRVEDPSGAFVCGGSFYVNYDPGDPPSAAWYSMGDWESSPFFFSGSPRVNYGDGMADGNWQQASELCYDGIYKGPTHNDTSVTQLSLRMSPDSPGQFGGALQPIQRYGDDPLISEPFLLSGGCYRGQMFDALTVGKSFATGFTGALLSGAYPWADGSTRPDGVPKNRLSADFDQATWENITDNYAYGALFVVSAIPELRKFNYAYEGKA